MGSVSRTTKAEEDLVEIWLYIADDNPDAADKVLDEIDNACQLLARSPQCGRLRKELAPKLRSFPTGNYVIFYRPQDDGIEVIRVLHGARDLPGLF